MKYVVTLFWFLVAFFVVIFTTLNSYSVTLSYHMGTVKVYLPLLLVIFLVFGAFLGMCALLPLFVKAKGHHSKLKTELKRSQKELDNLRTMPITGDTVL